MAAQVDDVALSEIAEINPPMRVRIASDARISFLGMKDVFETGQTTPGEERSYGEVAKGYTPFLNGDLLMAKITPCFQNNKIAQAATAEPVGFGSTEFHVIRPKPGLAEPRYVLHYLRQESIRRSGELQMTGSAGQRRVPLHFVRSLRIPLPALPEQRRVADILDRADALRAKRRLAITQMDTLAQSIFLEMFGDPRSNPRGWPLARLEDLLAMPMRNGVSPSRGGDVDQPVLTLSAVTGARFLEGAVKEGSFQAAPPPSQHVDSRDFLICRGNGNLSLVGRAHFPLRSMPVVVFPDTIIAARPDVGRIVPSYLEHVWSSGSARDQIEAAARTTNGTHKINQQSIGGVRFPIPPLELQRAFTTRIRFVDQLRTQALGASDGLDELFVTLQHRAFDTPS